MSESHNRNASAHSPRPASASSRRGRNGQGATQHGILARITVWTFRSAMALLTAVLCGLLLASGYSEWISPEAWILPSFLGLAFGVLLALGVVWTLILAVTRRWHCLGLMGATWVLIAGPAWRFCPLHPSGQYEPVTTTADGGEAQRATADGTHIEAAQRVRLLSYNTCLMGHARLRDRTQPVPVLDMVRASGADVVCLQEFSYSTDKRGYSLDRLCQRLHDLYPHHHFQPYSYNRRSGIALFSRYPIVKAEQIDPPQDGYGAAIYYQLDLGTSRLGVVSMHLQSNKFSKEDRQLYDDMVGHFATDSIQRLRSGLLHSLAVAWRQRSQEVDRMHQYLLAHHPQDMPLLICGDMNDTPVSYSSHVLRSLGLTDTWQETGFGPGITYSEHRFWFRIDHIFHSDDLRPLWMRVRKDVTFSDHYPVEAEFQARWFGKE